MDCFYTDRNQGRGEAAHYSARPKKLRTLQFPAEDLSAILEAELDKKCYGVEFVETGQASLSLDEYLDAKDCSSNKKYRFLIMVGDGDSSNDDQLFLSVHQGGDPELTQPRNML